jgi:hypothetical protein
MLSKPAPAKRWQRRQRGRRASALPILAAQLPRPSGTVPLRFAIDDDPAPDVHHRQAQGGLAEIGKADA